MKSNVFIITGFLGSGKTTLLKRILKSAKDLSRTVVIVNEFGKVGIDGSLIKDTATANIVELNSGCICCSLKLDMIQTLQTLKDEYAPERVIIEASGVADPLSIIETLYDRNLAPYYSYEKTIMVVAADFWGARHVFGSVFKSQLKQADLILLNKIDTIEKSTIPSLLKEIQKESATGQIIPTLYGNIDPNILWACKEIPISDSGSDLFFKAYDPEKDLYAPVNGEGSTSAKQAGFITFLYETPLPFDEKKFKRFIRTVPLELFRIKGPVQFSDRTDMLNFVGGKSEWIKWHGHTATCLTFIGWNVAEDMIFDQLNRCI
ncbi:MAG: GTP-binding protein [Deltaproteobacteria bacterium]|uniref:CobW family GTP-binding protein n=1 Tax=Desulfobacula sp. TaxID=2593537 RepID=UPI0019BEC699|nr:GTP-binding protein [Candidatus Desulfobacula maris]MBL6992986.1 GTP-binding protein [Desulfobacula sp.]